jgi:subtilisin family serine protease
VRDVAPEAEIYLVRVAALTAVENAVDWAIRHDIDVISMSMGFYNTSFYDGSGPFHDLLVDLEAAGILMVVSAGNNAQGHWSGPWADRDRDGRLDAGGDNAIMTELRPGSHTFYVAWNQYGRCGDTDLDVALVTDDRRVLATAAADQDADADSCASFERLTAEIAEDGVYRLEVSHRRGVTATLQLDVLARDASIVDSQPAGALADPAAQPLAFSIAAVDVADWETPVPESFSSQGPNQAGAPKPDLAGPDGVTTSSAGAVGFFGTSASAPAVAGLVALVLADDPSLTPRDAARHLMAWALPQSSGAWDPAFGAGLAHLPPPGAGSPCGEGRGSALLLLPLAWVPRGRRRHRISP